MSCSEIDILLDDYVDGDLGSVERRQVEAHVASCAGCRGALEELRRLQHAVRALPRGLLPERDLLPGVLRGVRRRPPLALAGYGAAAAAAVLVLALGAWLGLRERGPAVAPSTASGSALPAAALTLSEFEAAELEYERAAARLLEVLEARRDALSPETRRIVTENLQVIDLAIEKARAALEADPTDARNGHTLNALHRQKVELLWRLSRVSS
jgi:hypothetical protein